MLDGGTALLDRRVPIAGQPRSDDHAKLGVCAVVCVTFFSISGGPVGGEQIVSACGPMVGLGALLLFGLIYSAPQALVAAELTTALPHNGGNSLWVQAAFGNFWGMQVSYYSLISNVVDMALYPLLLFSTMTEVVQGSALHPSATTAACYASNSSIHSAPREDDAEGAANLWVCMIGMRSDCATEYLIKLSVVTIFVLPNLVSTKLLGRFLITIGVITVVPVALLVAFAFPKVDLKNLQQAPSPCDWSYMVTIIFWCMAGFDQASAFADEVQRPSRTFPIALPIALAAIMALYAVPLAVTAGADSHWHCWIPGSLARLARSLGGDWLGYSTLLSLSVSAWGLFSSKLLEVAFQLCGMSEVGLAPQFFARRVCGELPLFAIALAALVVAVLVGMDFSSILCIDIFFAAAKGMLEFAAVVQLRVCKPHLPRPYRIPLPTKVLAAALSIPFATSIAICYITLVSSIESTIVCIVGVASGLVLGGLHRCGTMEANSNFSGMCSSHGPVNAAAMATTAEGHADDSGGQGQSHCTAATMSYSSAHGHAQQKAQV